MDSQTLVIIALAVIDLFFAIVGVLAGMILGNITKSIDRLDKDVRNLPTTYVAKSDYRDDLHRIEALLTKIDDKLDGKVDK